MAASTITPPNAELQQDTGGAPVQQKPDPANPPSFGKNNRHLPDVLKEVLTALIEEFQKRELYNRNVEGLTDRAMRFYDDGIQHFYPNFGTGAYQVGSAGATLNLDGHELECSEYLAAYNIFRARRRTIDAVLTQNPPGIIFEPDRPDRSEDIQASETAEGYRHLFDQKNDIPDIQQTVTRYFELSGRVVAWTHTCENQQKWGVNEQSEPRKMETTELFGTLESKVPIICRNQDAAVYCLLYRDPDVLCAKEKNPWLRNEDKTWKIVAGEGGPGESDWTRYMRLGVMQSAKGAYVINLMVNHLVTEMHAFIRPAAFQSERCDPVYSGPSGWDDEQKDFIREEWPANEDGEQATIGDVLRSLYPEGIHAVYLGKCYSESMPCSMDDEIDIVMSEKRDSLTGGALMEPMKVVQDGYNDFKNAEREFYEKGWPVTWFKGDQQDYDAFIDQKSSPAQFAMLKNPVGGPEVPIQNQFFKEPEMEAPESFVQCTEEYRTVLSQDVTGASPALEGVAGPHDETASQRAMDKAQSMGILGPTWSRVQLVFAGIYKKAALAASKNPDHAKEIVVATGNKQTTTIQLEKLTRGQFHCKPDTDSTFPESTAAKRAALQALLPQMASSPVGAEFFNSPDNWEELQQIMGFPDLTFTPAIAYSKQIRELEILIREAPVDNSAAIDQYNQQHAIQALQAMEIGLPAPPYAPPPAELPSIIPKKRDYHKWELAKCQEWLSSEDCWRLEMQDDSQIVPGAPVQPKPVQPGYSQNDHVRNVELHADMHEQALQIQMQAQAAAAQQQKPPSESINFKDESPQGQAAMNKQAGIATPGAEPAAKQVQGRAGAPGSPGKTTL
jgi:hypothetical protein